MRTKWLRQGKLALAAGGLSLVALTAAACSSLPANAGTTGVVPGGNYGTAELNAMRQAMGGDFMYYPPAQETGINVSGSGRVTVKPDLAIMNVAVEGFASTVAEARNIAATAMDSVIKALRDGGVAEKDIQTQYFNIQPRYSYEDVVIGTDGGRTIHRSEPKIIGYQVTNSITVKIRDLNNLSGLIDATVNAGGDAVRVHGVSFTVDDPAAVAAQARTLAVQDALAKAKAMASAAEASLGKLVFLSETGGNYPVRAEASYDSLKAAGVEVPPTPINPGDLDVTVTVQATWAIQ